MPLTPSTKESALPPSSSAQPAHTAGPSDPSGPADTAVPAGPDPTPPCGPDAAAWQRAARRLLAKTLAELAYEEVIAPEPDGTAPCGTPRYRLPLTPDITYRFHARRGAYGHWRVDPDSVTPTGDPLHFLFHAHDTVLGLSGDTTGHLIRELTATLAADTRLDATALTAAELADLDYAALEGHQTGHPWLIANKGRLGFSAADAERWAPEARTPCRLPWIAAHRDLARYRGTGPLATPDRLYSEELTPELRDTFARTLTDRGLDPADYLYLPVHPWQWDETIAPLYAPQIAAEFIVPLTTDNDLRLPQQSIRTFLNTSRPHARTVKLPLSVLNTLVWRGLPTERTLAAPAVTAWVQGLRDADPYLRDETRVILLGETASVTVEHPLYDRIPGVPYQYKELLGCIWREPVAPLLDPGERARTLASLLQTDPHGRALTAELVHRSGLAPHTWLRYLFAALLPPLLHFLYQYGTVFSPHGENAIVCFDAHDVPTRLAVKDFVDDVNTTDGPLRELAAMPEDVREVLLTEPPAFLTQFIHSGLFVGVFRYLAPLCEEQLGVPEGDFWSLVRAEILRHHERFPHLKERHTMFDLLTPQIERLCLNRNRLHMDGYRDRPERPHAAVHGMIPNPLHAP
ncbi:IucA/IucC family protein [Streptomyces violens]|uniref:IucA/IucC family protein n=1 Tax=Streptomyces violens TaxID=66377 RepID=UPI0006895B62|nr:IucA/IucC family protein [Streptomyces violens]